MQKRWGILSPEGGKALIFLLAALVILTLLASGCSRTPRENPPEDKGTGQGVEKKGEGDSPGVGKEVVTLYFADSQAEKLVGEEREVEKEELPVAILQELIKGSETGLGPTIPGGTKLLSLRIEDGVAYVDFSREFKDNHWGGSTGELMTVYSVVNSLARLPEIDKVQFLLEGEVKEELLGHMYYGEPIEPDWSLVS